MACQGIYMVRAKLLVNFLGYFSCCLTGHLFNTDAINQALNL